MTSFIPNISRIPVKTNIPAIIYKMVLSDINLVKAKLAVPVVFPSYSVMYINMLTTAWFDSLNRSGMKGMKDPTIVGNKLKNIWVSKYG